MIRLIKLIIWGHWHMCEWEPYGAQQVYPWGDGVVARKQPCRCKHCGRIKRFKIS